MLTSYLSFSGLKHSGISPPFDYFYEKSLNFRPYDPKIIFLCRKSKTSDFRQGKLKLVTNIFFI